MASLVLGAVGAGIGSMIGGTFLGMSATSIGWSIGSTLGSLLSTEKAQTQYGPRLGDLKVQSSAYGVPIPRVYGAMRVAGNMIWSLPIRETVHEEDVGGKGGGGGVTSITYTYSQTFAIALCEGEIVGVLKIWANGELIYNVGEDATAETLVASNSRAAGFTIYTGSETQEANSLIEADVGAGNAPAYRGTAYIVFNDLQLEKYGNRTPNIEAEVVGFGSTGEWVTEIAAPGSSEYNPVIEYRNGLLYVGIRPGSNAQSYKETVYDVGGNIVVPETTYTTTAVGGDIAETACRNWRGLYYTSPLEWRNTLTGISVTVSDPPSWLGALLNSDNHAFIKLPVNAMVMIAAHDGIVSLLRYPWWDDDSGVPAPHHDLEKTLFSYATINERGSYADILEGSSLYYLFELNGASDSTLHKYDIDGTLLDYWTIPAGYTMTEKATYKVEDGIFYSIKSPAYAYRLNGDHTVTELGTSAHGRHPTKCAIGVPALYWMAKWVFRLGPPLAANPVAVSAIVEAECARGDLSGAQIDTSALSDVVPGYVIGQRGAIRAGIEPLMRAVFFDAVEVDEALTFVKRGGALAASIDEDDLGAHPYGAAEPEAVTLDRSQDVELPDEISVIYADVDAAYQVGAQYARRLIGSSRMQQSVQLPIALDADAAKKVADVLLYDAWQCRVAFQFATGVKHSALMPTDVISLEKDAVTYTARIVTREDDGTLIRFTAVWEDLQVYNQSAPAASLPAPDDDVALTPATRLALLDIPLLRDVDDGVGIYTAACGYAAGWGGCQIFKSADAGASWLGFGRAILNDSAIGFATTVLGDFTQNLFDEQNTVTVRLISGTLASASEAAVLNGANAAMLGDELIQFRTATLVGTSTYTLSGLLRGRRGSEWASATHIMGERFVLLGATTTYAQHVPIADLAALRHYRGVSFGTILEAAEQQPFTYAAVSSTPLAPVLLGGGRNAAGDVTINWVRRGRLAPEWTDYADVPVGEESEAYEVEIWNSGYTTLKRTITGLTSPTASYTSAQQTTDFGGNQSTIYVRVYQLSATVGRGRKLEGTV